MLVPHVLGNVAPPYHFAATASQELEERILARREPDGARPTGRGGELDS